jgi:SAM-dependent methyltransferase
MGVCGICKGEISQTFRVREMMFGFREEFDYFQCEACECLQIAKIPSNLKKYYGENYYSLQCSPQKKSRIARDFIRKSRARYAICGTGLIGWILSMTKAPDPMHSVYRRVQLKPSDRLLDVGGGAGGHVASLQSLGFRDVMSVDPNIDEDVFNNGALIAKKSNIFDIGGEYDLITFHHSLEHMTDQVDVMKKAAELIGKNGRILVRIPTVTSDAWNIYRENWVNLDAPRHFYLHSYTSIRHLAEQAKLNIIDFWNDSVAFQFWGSEQFIKDIPLNDPLSYSQNQTTSIFSEGQIRDFQAKADALNHAEKGDWICVLLSNNTADVK